MAATIWEEVVDIIFIFIIAVGFGILPLCLTVLNIIDLKNAFSRKEKHTQFHLTVTVIWGAVCYWILYLLMSITDVYSPFDEAIPSFGMHEPFSSYYMLSLVLFAAVGFCGLLVVGLFKEKINLPIKIICLGFIFILNGLSFAMCIQWLGMIFHHPIALCLFVLYHFNLFILSIIDMIIVLRGINKKRRLLFAACAAAFVSTAVIEILLSLTGQGLRGPVQVFTQTADWTFSQCTSPPSLNISREHWGD